MRCLMLFRQYFFYQYLVTFIFSNILSDLAFLQHFLAIRSFARLQIEIYKPIFPGLIQCVLHTIFANKMFQMIQLHQYITPIFQIQLYHQFLSSFQIYIIQYFEPIVRKQIFICILLRTEIINKKNMSSEREQNNLITLKSELSAKTLSNGCTTNQIKTYFLHSYSTYEKLFAFIRDQKSYYTKPEPLRHPLIFYFGHTACVYMNKLFDRGLIQHRVNPKFQSIFAVGVDEMDWDDLNDTHYDWPSVRDVIIFRDIVKNIVLGVIDKISPQINWNSDAWVIMMGIQHQKIHLETSSVIIRRLPIREIRAHQVFIDCPKYVKEISETPKNELKVVPSYKFEWDRKRKNAKTYGWDNEFGEKLIDVQSFNASSMLVSNGQYLEFVQDKGYARWQFWDEQGRSWLQSVKPEMPLFWALNKNGNYTLRTMNTVMPLPYDWPVQVNNLQATAFCNWKGQKLGKKLRLPTEDEYFALRSLLPGDHISWSRGQGGNINMEYWFSPNPVNYFKTGDFYDIVGNVWQHSSTPIYPFGDFDIHPIYEDFTTPTFDGRHFMIKGGSFVSCGNEAMKHSRYAFRRHFYQFAGFRYVESENNVWNKELIDESDQIVEKFLKIQYLTPKSYAEQVCGLVKNSMANQSGKCLTVGCSVGRIVMEMSKYFSQSYGVDYSARFFQMATRLYEKGYLKYKDIEIKMEDYHIIKENIVLYQMNPENPDPKKINDFSVAIFDGLAIKHKTIKNVLRCMKRVIKEKAEIIIISSQNRNHVSLQDLKEVMGKAELVSEKYVQESEPIKISIFRIEQIL